MEFSEQSKRLGLVFLGMEVIENAAMIPEKHDDGICLRLGKMMAACSEKRTTHRGDDGKLC